MAILAKIFLYYMCTGYHKFHRMDCKFVSLYAKTGWWYGRTIGSWF